MTSLAPRSCCPTALRVVVEGRPMRATRSIKSGARRRFAPPRWGYKPASIQPAAVQLARLTK
eukprot:15433560-Heterocapsa_arctica.AAC.1